MASQHEQGLRQVHFQSHPRICVRIQSKATSLHSAIRSSALALLIVFVYSLSTAVDLASCSPITAYGAIEAKDVAPTSFGTFNFRELEEIVYDIEILKVPVPEPSDHEGLGAQEDGDRLEGMEGKESSEELMSGKAEKLDEAKSSHTEVKETLAIILCK